MKRQIPIIDIELTNKRLARTVIGALCGAVLAAALIAALKFGW